MAQEEVEADFFYWDESNKEEEELMIGVGRETEQVKQTQEEKAGKRKNNAGKETANSATPSKQSKTTVDVQSYNNIATKTVAEQMRERGEGYVDDESKIKTPVEAQWVLKLGSMTFNIRAVLLALLKHMATVDATIYIKTGETKV
eukprot:1055268-Ditylum_brightwellii.AAC.1